MSRVSAVAVSSLLLALIAMLGACQSGQPVEHPEDVRALLSQSAEPYDGHFVPLSAEERAAFAAPAMSAYKLGVGDAVHVAVPGQEAFVGFGETAQGEVVGTEVKQDGNLYLPIVQKVPAAGRTVLDVQEDIRKRLDAKALKGAFVSADIVRYRSQKFFVLGEVNKPGAFPVDGRVSFLEAVSMAGGLRNGHADAQEAYLVRNGKAYPVSVADILYRAHPAGMMSMTDRDLIFVPHRADREEKVYVLGEVQRPGVVAMNHKRTRAGVLPGRMTLAEAIAAAGGFESQTADQDRIRIFRGAWGRIRCFTISANEIYKYGERILLHPGDRILVAPTELSSYSNAVQQSFAFLQGANTAAALALTYDALND